MCWSQKENRGTKPFELRSSSPRKSLSTAGDRKSMPRILQTYGKTLQTLHTTSHCSKKMPEVRRTPGACEEFNKSTSRTTLHSHFAVCEPRRPKPTTGTSWATCMRTEPRRERDFQHRKLHMPWATRSETTNDLKRQESTCLSCIADIPRATQSNSLLPSSGPSVGTLFGELLQERAARRITFSIAFLNPARNDTYLANHHHGE